MPPVLAAGAPGITAAGSVTVIQTLRASADVPLHRGRSARRMAASMMWKLAAGAPGTISAGLPMVMLKFCRRGRNVCRLLLSRRARSMAAGRPAHCGAGALVTTTAGAGLAIRKPEVPTVTGKTGHAASKTTENPPSRAAGVAGTTSAGRTTATRRHRHAVRVTVRVVAWLTTMAMWC